MIEEQWPECELIWTVQSSISDMIANNPHFRPSIEMCYKMSFTQWLIIGKIKFHPITVIRHFVGWIWEDFVTLGTLYCLISATRGNIMCIDAGTYDTICISLTLAIRYIDVSVNRYTPKYQHSLTAKYRVHCTKIYDIYVFFYSGWTDIKYFNLFHLSICHYHTVHPNNHTNSSHFVVFCCVSDWAVECMDQSTYLLWMAIVLFGLLLLLHPGTDNPTCIQTLDL